MKGRAGGVGVRWEAEVDALDHPGPLLVHTLKTNAARRRPWLALQQTGRIPNAGGSPLPDDAATGRAAFRVATSPPPHHSRACRGCEGARPPQPPAGALAAVPVRDVRGAANRSLPPPRPLGGRGGVVARRPGSRAAPARPHRELGSARPPTSG